MPSSRWYLDRPTLVGNNPFHIKGTTYRGLLAFVEHRITGGVASVLDHARDPDLAKFISQPFLAASWYDFFPLVSFSGLVAETVGLPLDAFATHQGRAQAEYDATHAYKSIMKGRTHADIPMRFPLLIRRYYDFGEFEAYAGEEPGRVHVIHRRMPAWVMPWFVPMQIGYGRGVATTMGERPPEITALPLIDDGSVAGIPAVRLDLEYQAR